MKKQKNDLRESAVRMAENYKNATIPMYGNARRLPDRAVIIEIIRDFQKLLFPIYYGEKELLRLPPEQYASLMLDRIADKLTNQIARTMKEENDENRERAKKICEKVLNRLPDIQQMVLKDLQAQFDGDPAAHDMEEVIFSYPGLFAIYIYRIAHELYLEKVPMIPRIMTEYAHSQTGIDINPGATIGEYFFIDHGTGIVIGETSIIGDHVNLYQGVTLGAMSPVGMESNTETRRHPKVGNNVTIYASATLLGGDTDVGNNVVIGSNVFLTESVKSDTVVSIKKPEVRLRDKEKRGK